MKTFPLITTFLFLISCGTHEQSSTENPSHLGNIDHAFPVSEGAKKDFDEGLLLLHSFEYDDAREAFRQAQQKDSTELMIYWGLAMTHYKALWGLQDVEAGRAVISEWERLKKKNIKVSGLERDFWRGVLILYDEGELKERNQKYAEHMASMYQQYPDNLEVAAFYALGLMWADYQDPEYLEKSARVASGIIEENPNHPGALHYLIHAYDNPKAAQKALSAADVYADVAPYAAHALHMPSHIYVALGLWNEVVTSNTASYNASLKRVEQKGLSGKDRGYHSMAWLHYGLLQQGRYEEAADLLREKVRYYLEGEGSDGYMINMQNQQRIEAGYWPADITAQHVDDSALGLEGKSQLHFFRAMLAFDKGDVSSIQAELDTLLNDIQVAGLLIGDEGVALCSAGPTRYAPSRSSMAKADVIIEQMNALLAELDGDVTKTEAFLKKATELESLEPYDPGPPFIAYPSFEQYGDWLLDQERYEEALVQFNRSLKNRVNRSKALKGKMEALKKLGREDEADDVAKVLNQFTYKRITAL